MVEPSRVTWHGETARLGWPRWGDGCAGRLIFMEDVKTRKLLCDDRGLNMTQSYPLMRRADCHLDPVAKSKNI